MPDRHQPFGGERYAHRDPDPRSMLQVEAEIRRLSGRVSQLVLDLIGQSQEWAEAKHTYELNSSQAYLRVRTELLDEKPTIPEIEAHVLIATADEHQAMLNAEALMKATRLACQSHIAQLDALRSINANARAAADFTRGEGG
jgi:hypothetical protein